MKGYIFVPAFREHRYEEHNAKALFHMLCDEYGFELAYTDNPEVPFDTDIVITHAIPHHGCGNPHLGYYPLTWLGNLSKHTKTIAYMRDLWNYDVPLWENRMYSSMYHYDKIVSHCGSIFKRKYSEFVDKFEFFPQFIQPEFYQIPMNFSPIMKCMVSGMQDMNWYPLRTHMIHNDPYGLVEHPNVNPKDKKIQGQDYVDLLHSYFCNATDCLAFGANVLKHVEIPASGSLLLTDHCEDLDRMGLYAGKHYVQIMKDSVFETIRYVIEHPEEYDDMRLAAREVVFEQHTIHHRFNHMKRIIEEVMDES